MAQDVFQYDKMVEAALRGVVRETLTRAARDGLRGGHHFYITFRTPDPGVLLPPQLMAKYPDEMTIVLQHQFWGLDVRDQDFSVTLSFQSKPEQLTIPFAAITSFADPSVKFGLQFAAAAAPPSETVALPAKISKEEPAKPPRQAAEVVTLDKFRKR